MHLSMPGPVTLYKTDFSSLTLQPSLLKNLTALGYLNMTPIQAASLPAILAGSDVIAQGKTGSGKTAAFGLCLIDKLNVKKFAVQALVLCPTRELADQVAREIRRLARTIHNIKVLTLCGGSPFGPQIRSLEHGAHIIVGTPGRVEEHLRKKTLELNRLDTFVLDEADRMLDMGFQATLDAIMQYLPDKRQTLLFSATYPSSIKAITKRVMADPVVVQVAATHDNSSIEQTFYELAGTSRQSALRLLLLKYRSDSALVFCNTRREAQEVADVLCDFGFSALALHGDLEQRVRDQILVRFANKSTSILVATDVAARGLDIDSLDTVINYHIARDTEVHLHRIGRTGRIGRKGVSCTLFDKNEQYKITRLEQYLKRNVDINPLPDPELLKETAYQPAMSTLQIDGGKKQKLRAGDILGALTGQRGVDGKAVGKINIFEHCSYVAIKRGQSHDALAKITKGKLKGRSFRARIIGAW
jgi:ATP-independent RNA helicase DbpA